MVMHLLLQFTWLSVALSQSIIPPGCQETCDNISVPYPFGTRQGCYKNEGFKMTCNDTFDPPRLFIGTGSSNLEVVDISISGELKIRGWVSWDCYSRPGVQFDQFNGLMDLTESSPYTFSNTRNIFAAVGCDAHAYILGSPGSACTSRCERDVSSTNVSCSGTGCCQANIPRGLKRFDVRFNSTDNHTRSWAITPCSYAFLVDQNRLPFTVSGLLDVNFLDNSSYTLPVAVDWVIGSETCEEAQRNLTTYACGANSSCHDSKDGSGYICSCLTGQSGNPYIINGCLEIEGCLDPNTNPCQVICNKTNGGYTCSCPPGAYGDGRKDGEGCKCPQGYHGSTNLTHGCQDIDECADANSSKCQHLCTNTPGSYQCSCLDGYHGDGRTDGEGCILDSDEGLPVFKIALGVGLGILCLLVGSFLLYWNFKKRRLIKRKEKFYRKNGGLLLQQKLSQEGVAKMAKIFTVEELKKATNNYDECRIIGQGGYGTVYKGILPGNKIVAIKKSKKLDASQIEQFVNEIVILSQVNHRNIVKLLGCCLETQVPSLVYEYVSNGTLFQHIHDEGIGSSISWENRLRIAIEAAGALAYLHSSTSIPIIHRDIKSTNILLDSNYTAKVSDFGASRSVPFDKTHITTPVQGTFGYLDPEYFRTSKLTEKSDVYSFGVVLVELLTREKPISSTRPEEDGNLVTFFISSMNENRLLQILDSQVVNEAEEEQLLAVADLAKRCLRQKGEERPAMKEVAAELEGLKRAMEQPSNLDNHLEDECLLNEVSLHNPGDEARQHSLEKQFLMSLDVPR